MDYRRHMPDGGPAAGFPRGRQPLSSRHAGRDRLRLLRPVRRRRYQAGFTLIELLVVASILVVVAAIGVPAVVGALNVVNEDLARTEMRNIASGIQRFYRDTGFFPKQGPFALVADGGQVPADTDAPLGSPANLVQLFESPTDASNDEIMPWNVDTARGWNGPYLSSFGEGTVTIGANFGSNGSDSPGPLSGAVRNIAGVADPFRRAPSGLYFEWAEPISGDTVPARGRPYFFFVDTAAEANVVGCIVPCLLSLGANGRYDAGADDDIVLNL